VKEQGVVVVVVEEVEVIILQEEYQISHHILEPQAACVQEQEPHLIPSIVDDIGDRNSPCQKAKE